MRLSRFCFAVMFVIGCDEGHYGDDDDEFVERLPNVIEVTRGVDGAELVTFRQVADNGIANNGYELNGFRFNGFRFNGFRFNGFRFNGVELNTSPVTNVQYEPSTGSLSGTNGQSNTVGLGPGSQLVAQGDLDAVTEYETKISEVEQLTLGGQSFQFQRVQTRTLPGGSFSDTCKDGTGNPTKAILLKGDWAAPTFSKGGSAEAAQATTWACRGAALAKCVEWGYHPERVVSSQTLADHHQACTRMVRADYCGNGNHRTENGTLIDVQDNLGIQTHDTSWNIEAAWGISGALCLNDPRKTYWTRSSAITGCSSLPSCDANSDSDLTNDTAYWFGQGALFVTRNQPTSLSTAEPAPGDSGG